MKVQPQACPSNVLMDGNHTRYISSVDTNKQNMRMFFFENVTYFLEWFPVMKQFGFLPTSPLR